MKFLKECSPDLDKDTNNLGVKKAFKIIEGNPMENQLANNCKEPGRSNLVNRVLANNKIHIENNERNNEEQNQKENNAAKEKKKKQIELLKEKEEI